jgi:hypothetical protein
MPKVAIMTNLALPPAPEHLTYDEKLGQKITLLAGQMNVGSHSLLTLIAEFDERKGWSGDGTMRSCAHWLNWQCGIALGAAREKVRVARCLQKLPPEAGALVVKAIEAVATPVQVEKQQQLQDPEKNVPAETFSEVVKEEEPSRFQDLLQHTRADALVTMAEHFLATANQNPQFQGLKGSERCQILLHVNINTLREHGHAASAAHPHCHMDDKHWVSPATAKRLSCDASLVTVLEDEQGRVLNIGRRSRTVPAAINRALNIRDKTCRVPGCCESRYVDAHHIKHWADGGDTSMDNLVTLCRKHHRQLHQGCFTISVEKTAHDQQLVFATPTGKKIQTSFFPQFPNVSAETSANVLRYIEPSVDSKTCIPHWHGESCDYGMAVSALSRRDGISP